MITKLTDIKPNPNNPRVIRDENFKKLVKSIKEFPEMLEVRPIVVNKDMVILGGNMRYRACQEAGLKEAPVMMASWESEKDAEFVIKDNLQMGDWDWEILSNTFDESYLDDWGLDVPYQQEEEEQEISYNILITCTSQEEQMSLYSELEAKGVKAKMK